ncbi:Crp/Fnr family transcriptional regulator [Neolewinella agarilytica]|uniref:cAMP-binding domain of CRP or a regulatory subunit of cAMP-dependent protein kinases n=1 Tax=Neolewinella agarilytica TaxID=478744 RepID=A0A1H9GEA7_9BACT|nr:Crp/Fnr family transcriptional regulator [Neolewinella agarilytica]SEQ48462.1 cAMP-binding domain of CRP or a regulatory subunit of cAMP-dependent protein kinases [Neolewinella agarilytica]
MADQQLWFVENIDLQNIFCPKKVDMGMIESKDHLSFDANQYVYLPEEPAKKIFLINSGRIKIGTYGAEGKEVTKAILTPGEVFGELALVNDGSRRDFAYSLEPTSLCVLEKGDLENMLRERSELQLFFMRLIGNRTLQLEQRLENLMFKTSRSRIVEFLHELATSRGRAVGYEREVRNMLTHKEIADLTGTSRQTVNAVLNDLRRQNILTFDRKRMLVRDMEKLVAAA